MPPLVTVPNSHSHSDVASIAQVSAVGRALYHSLQSQSLFLRYCATPVTVVSLLLPECARHAFAQSLCTGCSPCLEVSQIYVWLMASHVPCHGSNATFSVLLSIIFKTRHLSCLYLCTLPLLNFSPLHLHHLSYILFITWHHNGIESPEYQKVVIFFLIVPKTILVRTQ